MWINRVILVTLILASGIFASFYGGNAAYAFFYFTLLVPLVSIVYTFYVYVRFRLYQDIGQKIVVKGELVPYSFTVGNERYITFRSVKVNFLHDKSKILNAEDIKDYCLLPNSGETMETKLRCNYRGTYHVGANSIDITDFLCLFKITYPIQSKVKVTVLPRVVEIDRMGIAPAQKDVKTSPYLIPSSLDILDAETRKYIKGDGRKQIHWKITAKRQELYSRKYISNPKTETVIIMDLQPVQGDDMTATVTEDQIIESALAIANYYYRNNTPVAIVCDHDRYEQIEIKTKTDFDLFYRMCVHLRFDAKAASCELLKISYEREEEKSFYILITHRITKELFQTMLEISQGGSDVSVLLIKDKTQGEEADIIEQVKSAGIAFRLVTREDEIGEVLHS